MIVHLHLAKTAGTTFNFGVVPNVLAPHKTLFIGDEMPASRVEIVNHFHLKSKSFISGHRLLEDAASPVLQEVVNQPTTFLFSFARPGRAWLTSWVGQYLRQYPGNVDYDMINRILWNQFHVYTDGVARAFKHPNFVLIRSGHETDFDSNLQFLNDLLNFPPFLATRRNVGSAGSLNVDWNKISMPDINLIDDIYREAVEYETLLPRPRFLERFAHPPRSFEVVADALGAGKLRVRGDKNYMLWLTEDESLEYRIYPRIRKHLRNLRKNRPNKTGIRNDLMGHIPSFKGSGVPKSGIGIPLRFPFDTWTLETNRPGQVVGQVLSYEIGFLN